MQRRNFGLKSVGTKLEVYL